MAIGKLVKYVRDARAEGHNDIQIRQALLGVSWSERDIKEALAAADIPTYGAPEEKALKRTIRLSRVGRLLYLLFTLLELVIIVRIGCMYAGLQAHPLVGPILASATDWLVALFTPLEPLLVTNGQLLGTDVLALDTLLLVPGGRLDVAAIVALFAYAIIYTLVAKIIQAVYRRVKRG